MSLFDSAGILLIGFILALGMAILMIPVFYPAGVAMDDFWKGIEISMVMAPLLIGFLVVVVDLAREAASND